MELSVVSHWDAGQLERKEMPEHYGSLMQVGLQPTQHLALLHSTAIPCSFFLQCVSRSLGKGMMLGGMTMTSLSLLRVVMAIARGRKSSMLVSFKE